jgi:hypothetical protein
LPSFLQNTAKLTWRNITIDKNNYFPVKKELLKKLRPTDEKLKLKTYFLETTTILIAANKQSLSTLGRTTLMLRLGSSEYLKEAIVIEVLSTDLLLGTDWLKKNGAAINFARNTLTIGRQEFQLLLRDKQVCFQVSAVKQIKIKPLSSIIEWINLPDDFKGEVLFEYLSQIRNLEIREGLFEVKNGQIQLLLLNKNKFQLSIGKGKFLGRVEQIDIVDQVNSISKEIENPNQLSGLKFDENLNTNQQRELKSLLNKYSHICTKTGL